MKPNRGHKTKRKLSQSRGGGDSSGCGLCKPHKHGGKRSRREKLAYGLALDEAREPRNWNAVNAWLRSGAGPMKDRRSPRGGARNTTRDALEDL